MSKTAIITGGSRGIGKAMSEKLGELGYNVVINYRSDSSKSLSEKIASETGVSSRTVQYAGDFVDGMDAAEEVLPGVSKDILSGIIKPK